MRTDSGLAEEGIYATRQLRAIEHQGASLEGFVYASEVFSQLLNLQQSLREAQISNGLRPNWISVTKFVIEKTHAVRVDISRISSKKFLYVGKGLSRQLEESPREAATSEVSRVSFPIHPRFPSDGLIKILLESHELIQVEKKIFKENFLDSMLDEKERKSWIEAIGEHEITAREMDVESARRWVNEEIRLFVEKAAKVTLKDIPMPDLQITSLQGTRFLPSIAESIIRPFGLVGEFVSPFLHQLLKELKVLALNEGLKTRHGKLLIRNGDLCVGRVSSERRSIREKSQKSARLVIV